MSLIMTLGLVWAVMKIIACEGLYRFDSLEDCRTDALILD